MKKYILSLAVALIVGSFSITSCSGDRANDSTEEVAEAVYYCPMKCEEEKTYTEAGSCPVCGMDLVEQ